MSASTKVAIMQPYFFPYIGYWQLINTVDTFVIYDDVNFIKRGWVNRNNILVNNTAKLVSVPLIKASQNKLINQISVFTDDNWQEKFLRTIKLSYQKAKYFESVNSLIERIVLFNENNLAKFLTNQILEICYYLNIDTKIEVSSMKYDNQSLKAESRILDICKQEKASLYINPQGGKELYNATNFRKEGIELKFLNTGNIRYSQLKSEFVPYLSIIDVLMFNPKEKVKELLLEFNLSEK